MRIYHELMLVLDADCGTYGVLDRTMQVYSIRPINLSYGKLNTPIGQNLLTKTTSHIPMAQQTLTSCPYVNKKMQPRRTLYIANENFHERMERCKALCLAERDA